VMNRRMTDCIVPTFADAPEMETILVEEPYPFGPHGAKGVGEIPMDGPAAAVANAIEDALGGDATAACDRLPILPESIERALAAAASARSPFGGPAGRPFALPLGGTGGNAR
jgi:CO/xanthine dehydrogenase Mo-binding subunit